MVVSQGLHRIVDGRGDDHLHDIAVMSRSNLHLGSRGRRRSCPGYARPRTKMGVVPEQGPGINMGMAHSSTTSCSVAMRWGHRRWSVYCPGVSTVGNPL